MLSPPPEKEVLRSWLPPQQLRREVTELLPDNLVPMLDPCLAKFYLSPIDVADPNYCVYFDNAEFQVRACLPRGGYISLGGYCGFNFPVYPREATYCSTKVARGRD